MLKCVYLCEHMLVSYHDGGDYNSTVFHARSVIWKQWRVLDKHQFVCVVPVADLQGKENMRLPIPPDWEYVHVHALCTTPPPFMTCYNSHQKM